MVKAFFTTLAALPLVIAMTGCEPEEGSAERMGERVDEAVEKTGDVMQDAAEKAGEKLERAGDEAQDRTN